MRRENKFKITDKTDWKLSKTEKQLQNEKEKKEKKAKWCGKSQISRE